MSEQHTGKTNQYLTFSLADEWYAIEVSMIKEVLEYQTITRVPKTPPSMKGVINVRGGVIPVVDMREKFELPVSEPTIDTCIIVLEVSVDGETIVIGTIADFVDEVLQILPENIEPSPKIGTGLDTDFIDGIGKMEERFIIILNTDRIFTAEEVHGARERAGSMSSS
jgi:purine-binding chemotaxis protein CheW